MSQPRCPYCGSTDGCITTTTPVLPSPLFVKECKSCGRIVEEYCSSVQDMFVERAEDTQFCIVTPDFSNNEEFRTAPIEDDPYENIGFITAFSTWSMELAPLYTSTTSSFCGYLAELERVLLNPVSSTSDGVATTSTASNSSLVDNLRAYFHILEVSSLLGLDRDIADHAVQLFRDCSSAACMRNRNVEALATAALLQASREAKEARTLQELSTAANVSQKELHRYMKILTDALKLSQPIDSNSISVYMPRFCSILELEKSTQDLATHIGEVVMNKSFCTRRNPISISAAAIYLSCQLEDKRKTQTEICKATALTEVTLRKVYKELLEHINDLLPANYTPVVPLERALSVSGVSTSSRAPVTRGAGVGSNAQPLAANSSIKPNNNMDSTNLLQGNKDIDTESHSLATPKAEPLGLFDSRSCSKKLMVDSNDEKSRLIAMPLGTATAKASAMCAATSMAKSTLLNRGIRQWDRSSEAVGEAASSASNLNTMQHQLKSFKYFLQDAFTHSAAAGALSSTVVPQGGAKNKSSLIIDPHGLHHVEHSHVPLRDEPSTMPLQCEGKDLAKDGVYDRLTIDRGSAQEQVDNRGASNRSTSGCTRRALTTTASSWSSVSQRSHKGLWDLNLEDLVPEEGVFPSNLPAHDELGGHGLTHKKVEISASSEARHEVTSANFSLLGARNLSSEESLLNTAQRTTSCSTVQALHPWFWQPSLKFFSSSAHSISTSGNQNSNERGVRGKAAGAVDNQLHSATHASGKVDTSPASPLPIANLIDKLISNSEMTSS